MILKTIYLSVGWAALLMLLRHSGNQPGRLQFVFIIPGKPSPPVSQDAQSEPIHGVEVTGNHHKIWAKRLAFQQGGDFASQDIGQTRGGLLHWRSRRVAGGVIESARNTGGSPLFIGHGIVPMQPSLSVNPELHLFKFLLYTEITRNHPGGYSKW